MAFDDQLTQLELPELSLFEDGTKEVIRPAKPARKGVSKRGTPLPPLDDSQMAAARAIAEATDSKDTLAAWEEGVPKERAVPAGADRPVLYVDAVAGSGKCLAPGTPILLHDGRVLPVEQIEVGDLLMGPDSQPRRVESLARGREQMWRVIPVKGEPFVVNESHILSFKFTYARRQRVAGVWREQGDVVNLTVTQYQALTNSERKMLKAWRTGVDFPDAGPLHPEMPAYMLGLWLGDGSQRDDLCTGITKPDAEIAESVREYAAAIGCQVRERTSRTGCPTWVVTTGRGPGLARADRNPMREALRSLDLVQNRHIPYAYKCGTRQTRLEVLAGYLDADGHQAGGYYDAITKVERLADDICFLARSLGFAAYKSHQFKRNTTTGVGDWYWRLSISGAGLEELPVRIPRRRVQPRQQIKNVLHTGITLEKLEVGDYFGFTLSGPDRLFLLGDFTATHNTTVIMAALGEMGRHSDLLMTTFGTAPTKGLERRAKAHHPDLVVNKALVIKTRTVNSLGLSLLNANLNLTVYGKEEDGKTPEPEKIPGHERELHSLYNDPGKYTALAEREAQVAEVKALLPVKEKEGGAQPDPAPFAKLVDLCLTGLFKHPSPAAIAKVIEDHRLQLAKGEPTEDQLAVLARAVTRVQEKGYEAVFREYTYERNDGGIDIYAGQVSFLDQLWLPFYMDLRPHDCIKARAVIVDEYQDLSPAQLGIINRYMHPDTPLVMVGDRRQAIFGFNGAGGRAFDLMAHHFPGERIELNDSYRCPESHLAIARHFHSKVRRAANAGHDPLGSGVWGIEGAEMLELLKPGDVVLGRANSALVAAGLRYALRSGFDAKTGKPNGCRIVVKGLRGALLRTIDEVSSVWRKKTGKSRINFRTDFRKAMQLYAENLPRGADPDDLALLNVLYEFAHDRPEGATREKFATHCARVLTVEEPLANRSKVIEFRSVHSMKGDENDRVFVVGLGATPVSPFWERLSPLQKQEELNISYVALTRAKRELYLVHGFHGSMDITPHLLSKPLPRPED